MQIRKPWLRAALSCLLLIALPASARQDELINPPYQVLKVPAGVTPDMPKVEAAVRIAANMRGWQILSQESGKFLLRLAPGNHEIQIVIIHDDKGFDIDYVSSVAMNHELKRGKTWIHPSYNRWVNNLSESIQYAAGNPDDPRLQGWRQAANHLTLQAPVYAPSQLGYRVNLNEREEVRACEWGRNYSHALQAASKGLVTLDDSKVAEQSGYTIQTEVVNVHSIGGGGFTGPKWAVVRVSLYDGQTLIGRVEQRRQTGGGFSMKGCDALNRIAGVLAGDTYEWLRRGRFTVMPIRGVDDVVDVAGEPTSSSGAGVVE